MKDKNNQKNISRYNTFEVFENIYGRRNQQINYDELDINGVVRTNKIWTWFKNNFIVLVIALAIHPLLSYSLKTPYPLIVIAEDSMQPNLKHGDLVISTGVINPTQIQINDIIVYHDNSDLNKISIQRVVAINDDDLILQGDANQDIKIKISKEQAIAKIINGQQQPLRIPFVGKLSRFLAQI